MPLRPMPDFEATAIEMACEVCFETRSFGGYLRDVRSIDDHATKTAVFRRSHLACGRKWAKTLPVILGSDLYRDVQGS